MQNDYEKEMNILDDIYSEMIEAILNKPDDHDTESSNLYYANVLAHLNKWVDDIKNVKSLLEQKKPVQDLTADNRPA